MDSMACRCPNRPYFTSWARDSAMERAALAQWQQEHGDHAYAKARDRLAVALQEAEASVKRDEQRMAGAAVLDMVHDIMSMERRKPAPVESP